MQFDRPFFDLEDLPDLKQAVVDAAYLLSTFAEDGYGPGSSVTLTWLECVLDVYGSPVVH
jgi:hypothetical protein